MSDTSDNPHNPQSVHKPLSVREERFVAAYVGEAKGIARQAAFQAGYGSNLASSHVAASRLLDKPNVQARIAAYVESVGITAELVLQELAKVATADTAHFMSVVSPELKDEKGNVIRNALVRLDYSSKVKALELLGKYHQLFADRLDVNVSQKALIGIRIEDI